MRKELRFFLPVWQSLVLRKARQYSAAAALAIFAFVVAFRVFLNWRATLTWDDGQMVGTLTSGVPLKFADVERLDVGKWEPKQILVVHAKDGRTVTLDAWHHAGARELAEKLLAHEPPFAVSPV